MGFRINTNIQSLQAQRNLSKSNEALGRSSTRLSSGSRINKAADDAAGLAVSETMRANIRSLGQAQRNANDGVSMVQVAEGGLLETTNMLVRLRELAIQASSDTIGDRDREFLNREFVQLKDEIDRIANSTEFNGTYLLVGNSGAEQNFGVENRHNAFPLEIQVDKDYFEAVDSKDQINPVNTIKIEMGSLNTFTSGDSSLNLGKHDEGNLVDNKVNAQASITQIDVAMDKVNSHRAYIGAVQNRLESTIANLGVKIQGLSESRSRITDTDFAAESAKYTQASILQQAGTSILASANAAPQSALALLQ